jgi:hypothetical protein
LDARLDIREPAAVGAGAQAIVPERRDAADVGEAHCPAQEDIRRLAKYLNAEASGRRVLLAGFADAKGPLF